MKQKGEQQATFVAKVIKKTIFPQKRFECPIFRSILWNVKNIYLVCFFRYHFVEIEISSTKVININILKTASRTFTFLLTF